MKKSSASVDKRLSDDENFVRLIQVAREDPAVCRQLISVLSLDDFNRQSAINTWLEQLRFNRAPTELTGAIACLNDPAVAEKALDTILFQ